jgi:hypothetical protein
MYPNNSAITVNNTSGISALTSPQSYVCPTCSIFFGSGLGLAGLTLCNSGSAGGTGNLVISSSCGSAPIPTIATGKIPMLEVLHQYQEEDRRLLYGNSKHLFGN